MSVIFSTAMTRVLICLCLLIPAATLPAHSFASITPRSVENMLARYGARGTVQRLTRNSGKTDFGDFEVVLRGVAKGDGHWLRLVPRIYRGTDAGTAESLKIAVAEALPKNPVGVLKLVHGHSRWSMACTYPMIESSAQEARQYFRLAIPAVRSVRDRTLQVTKRRCLSSLGTAQHMP